MEIKQLRDRLRAVGQERVLRFWDGVPKGSGVFGAVLPFKDSRPRVHPFAASTPSPRRPLRRIHPFAATPSLSRVPR